MLLHPLLILIILLLHPTEGDFTPRSMCDAWNTIIQNSDSTNHTSAVTAARRVVNYVRPGSTVIDVGGHLGIFSQSMRSIFAPVSDPTPWIYGCCEIDKIL